MVKEKTLTLTKLWLCIQLATLNNDNDELLKHLYNRYKKLGGKKRYIKYDGISFNLDFMCL